ncbi:hypothetical protein AB4Y38_35520 [Paraburkholderia sp. EG285A]|uniref:hypothetical protein n=1 Tax=Paraburkholderia sp. EG285A TaxID=3237009 RepID=UPI0034D2A654
MKVQDFSIAFRYNGWFRIGWIFFPQSCVVLAYSAWYWIASMHDLAATVRANYLMEGAVLLFCLTYAPIFLTERGKGTAKYYHETVKRVLEGIEHNESRIAAGLPPLRLCWEGERYATTYCARAGVKAAACELNFELPPGYLKWWCIVDTNSRFCNKRRRTGELDVAEHAPPKG